MLALTLFIVGLVIGLFQADTRRKLAELREQRQAPPEPETGATDGSYGLIDGYSTDPDSEVGISEPKTPQMLDWEESEKLRKLQMPGAVFYGNNKKR